MATYDVLSKQGSYLTVRVLFADKAFEQLLITSKTGTTLDAFLKSYANAYETEWFLLKGVVNVPVE